MSEPTPKSAQSGAPAGTAPPSAQPPAPPAASSGGSVALTEPATARILVVDDNPAARYSTCRVLRAAGYQIFEAGTGTGALELAPSANLVVLDINLPDIDGFEVCRHLRANPSTAHVPVLHLSATFIHHGDFLVGLQAGADSYLTRPVEPQVLIASVRTLLFARQAEILRRGLDARLKEIFDLMPVPMVTLEGSFRIESVNPAFCALSGYQSTELLGRAGEALFESGELARGARREGGGRETQAARWMGRSALRRKAGDVVQVEWQLARESAGGMLILTLTDITSQQRAEAEREALLASERAARAEAERSNRLKEEFLATLSHELRTPLSAILGWSAVINRTEGLPAAVVQGVQAIERNSRLQAQMIADLLDYAGITYGKLRLATAIIDPYPVIRAALDVVQGMAHAAGVQLSANIAADGAHVEADPSRLQQMVWNLLSNAIKFSPRGGTVELQAGLQGGRFRVQIVDQGQGIAPEFLPRIFERFSQQDATSKRRHGGLGLGLAIVKQLAELHNGSVSADSAGPGRGAIFGLELPISHGRPQPGTLQMGDSELQRSLDLSGVTVLLVEDDLDARQLAKRVLSDAGAGVIEAANAQAALRAIDRGGIQMLVSDIGMAGEDGYELIRQVRARGYGPETLPAIALTAFARLQDREDALAAGFQDHLVKPFDAQSLIIRVASLRRAGNSGRHRSRHESG